MVKQTHDMTNEKKPNIKQLIPEGWQEFTIESCEPSISKAGNNMMVIGLHYEPTNYTETIFLVTEQGKRWLLKKLLTACGIAAGQDGVYSWDTEEIVGRGIKALVSHEENEYINREGESIKTKQNRITDFDVSETKGWDDNK